MENRDDLKKWFQDFKETHSDWNQIIGAMLETYDKDQLKSVRETLKLDGQKLKYRLKNEEYIISQKDNNKGLSVDVVSEDGTFRYTNFDSKIKIEELGTASSNYVVYDKKNNTADINVADSGINTNINYGRRKLDIKVTDENSSLNISQNNKNTNFVYDGRQDEGYFVQGKISKDGGMDVSCRNTEGQDEVDLSVSRDMLKLLSSIKEKGR